MSDKHTAPLLTDRELLIATFNAVSALAKELTGKRLTVQCRTKGGDLVIYGDPVVMLTPGVPEATAPQPSASE